jgi:uncharacterized protein (DUF1800 family)
MNNAFLAAGRFGYGATPAGAAAIARDPKAWAKAQLAHPAAPDGMGALPNAASLVAIEFQLRKERQEMKRDGVAPPDAKPGDNPMAQKAKQLYLDEVEARYRQAVLSPTPLVERLVAFWANHFTVSGLRPVVRPLAGAFEREAIRPYVLGRFEDLVLAVIRHPAMGLYLDNAVSVGPNSRAGQRRDRGLNENLGRELLELHTLGVDGGYTEEDVRALARILTGWSIQRLQDPEPGHFHFFEPIHEPGPKSLLGQTYQEAGMAEGVAAVGFLCRHPATARHIARQLAQHFIADQPPQSAIDHLAKSFRDSGGDLKAVTAALLDLPEAWQAPAKIKTPWDMVVSASVATGLMLPPEPLVGSLARLGQPTFMAPSPAGWDDQAEAWIGPEAVLRRVEWCQSFAERAEPALEPLLLADQVLGDALTATQRQAIAEAESRPQALAMVLASPAFQRR